MRTIREEFDRQIRLAEKTVAQLRGKRARLQAKCPEILDLSAPDVRVFAYPNDIKLTLYDREHKHRELLFVLAEVANVSMTPKKAIPESELEYFSFDVNGINIDVDRKLSRMKKCRKARVQRVIEICGEPDIDTEVIEWIDDEQPNT